MQYSIQQYNSTDWLLKYCTGSIETQAWLHFIITIIIINIFIIIVIIIITAICVFNLY